MCLHATRGISPASGRVASFLRRDLATARRPSRRRSCAAPRGCRSPDRSCRTRSRRAPRSERAARPSRRCRAPARRRRRPAGVAAACATLSASSLRLFERVRTLPASATAPSRTSMTGLIESIPPSSACAAPMRPPAAEVLERVERAEEPGPARLVLGGPGDLRRRRRPSLGHAHGVDALEPEAHRDASASRRPRPDRSPFRAFAATCAGLHGGGEAGREVDADDAVGALRGEPPEGGFERAGRRGRGLGEHVGGRDLAPELLVGELDPVDVLLGRRTGSSGGRSRCRAPRPGPRAGRTSCR